MSLPFLTLASVLVAQIALDAAPAPQDGGLAPTEGPAAPAQSAEVVRPEGFDPGAQFEAPFRTESLALSEVIQRSLSDNLDLRARLVDVSVSEAGILSALGAFDLILTAGVNASLQKSTPRGSAFVFSTGTRTLGGYLGFQRRLETGGNISLRMNATRSITDQPLSFFNPAAGSTELASYNLQPTLTLTHPLLRGFGIRVNRVAIDRARLATSQAEAAETQAAADLVRDIASAYWDVLFSNRDLENKRRALALAQEQLRRTQAQVQAGRLAPVDAKAVEQALALRESEVLVAENTLLDRSLTLRTLMGEDLGGGSVLGVLPSTDPESFVPAAVDVDSEIDRALAANFTIRSLEHSLASRRLDELEAANQRLPQLDLTASFSPQGRSVDTAPDPQSGNPGQRGSWSEAFSNFVNDDIPEDGLFAEYSVNGALDLTWDIRNRGAKGNHQRVLREVERAQINLQQTRQQIASAVIRSANALRTAEKRIDVAEVSVDLSEQNLAAEQARFSVGRSTNYDVLFRIDELAKAEAEALSARIDYLKAKVQLQALTGDILPAFGLDLSSRASG